MTPRSQARHDLLRQQHKELMIKSNEFQAEINRLSILRDIYGDLAREMFDRAEALHDTP